MVGMGMRMGRLGATALVLVLAACSSDSDSEAAAVPETETPTCTELVGMPTAQVVDTGACDDGETTQILATAAYDCADGRKLHWSDLGWGWSDGVWQAHARADGQLVPPDTDMAACAPA